MLKTNKTKKIHRADGCGCSSNKVVKGGSYRFENFASYPGDLGGKYPSNAIMPYHSYVKDHGLIYGKTSGSNVTSESEAIMDRTFQYADDINAVSKNMQRAGKSKSKSRSTKSKTKSKSKSKTKSKSKSKS